MSALPPKADIARRQLDVRFVPKADSCTAAKESYSITRKAVKADRHARDAADVYLSRPSVLLIWNSDRIGQASLAAVTAQVSPLAPCATDPATASPHPSAFRGNGTASTLGLCFGT